MPIQPHPRQFRTIGLSGIRAVDGGETDVLVVGGGLSGMGAAWAAAKAGVRVTLAERYGCLGGNATASLVTVLMPFYTQHPAPSQPGVVTLFPRDAGGGELVIGGALSVFVDALIDAGGAIPPTRDTGYTLSVDPEIFKIVATGFLNKAGVNILLHSFAQGTLGKKCIDGVYFATKTGLVAIRAKVVVDCTGDGDIAAWAGAPFKIGREKDGLTQPMTTYFRLAGFQRSGFAKYVDEHPDQWKGVFGLWDLVREATVAEDLELHRENIMFFATPAEGEVLVDSTRITRLRGTDVWDLSRAEWEGRRQMEQIARFLKKYVPGFEKTYISQSGFISVRETRRIGGEYTLTQEDVLSGRKFDDAIARCAYPIDIHNPDGRGSEVKHLPPGTTYDIPLRCLLPKNTHNILVAARCISGTHEALGSYRVEPPAMATGQAAGACAALAVKQGKLPREVDYRDVQEMLIHQKVILEKSTESAPI